MSEGIIQGFNAITMQIGLREEGLAVEQLKGKTNEDVQVIKETIDLLKVYFREVLPPSADYI